MLSPGKPTAHGLKQEQSEIEQPGLWPLLSNQPSASGLDGCRSESCEESRIHRVWRPQSLEAVVAMI